MDSLLKTKLNLPPVRTEWVARPRLSEALNDGLRRKLTLVAAPAGYGKTTLLSAWVRESGGRAAWLSLDRGDNDLARFLTYLVAALQKVESDVGVGVLAPLQSPQPSPIEAVLTLLINDLAAVAEPVVVILDDYHLIEAAPIHTALGFLLEHLPAGVHLIMAARADPPLPLARLRGRGQLVELREADLRFTPAEAGDFLAQTMGFRLGKELVAKLTTRTEGWIAGLQLAAVSMKGREDTQAFVEAFSGTHEYIVDYLAEEVLKRQSEATRSFLLQTSILDRLNGPLCAAVAERDDAQAILERLWEKHLFLLSLDDERRWYRYHNLFADMLRKRLTQERAQIIPSLHARAAAWYERNGQVSEAIDHALQAEDYDHAIAMVERVAQETLIRTEFVTFLKWAAALPEELVRARPRLCVYYASALIFSGREVEMAQSLLQDAARSDESDSLRAEVAFFQAVIAMLRGDVEASIVQSEHALELLAEDQPFLRSLVISHLGVGYISSGDVEAASAIFAEAAEMGERSGSYLSSVMAIRRLAEMSILKGELRGAWALCERGLRIAAGGQGKPLPVAGLIKTVQGDLLREWNDLEAAREHLEAGLELVLQWSELMAIDDYIALARVRQSQGDARGASEAMTTAEQIARESDASRVAPILVSLHRPRLWITQGNLQAAARWAAERLPIEQLLTAQGYDTAFYHHIKELEGLTLARLHLAQGEPGRALAILEPLYEAAESLGRGGSSIEMLVLQALSLKAQGDLKGALKALEAALRRAEPQGYVRLFLDGGEPMRALLTSLVEAAGRRDRSGDPALPLAYMQKLLAGLQAERIARKVDPPASPRQLTEALSDRELEVLRLLVTHLTSREIAEELYISVNTVRFHTKNIYGKLGVHRRADAVERARELGLL